MYIFAVLPDTGVAKDCEKAEESLNDYFATQVNVPFERHQFREMHREQVETIDQFVVLLKQKTSLVIMEIRRTTKLEIKLSRRVNHKNYVANCWRKVKS